MYHVFYNPKTDQLVYTDNVTTYTHGSIVLETGIDFLKSQGYIKVGSFKSKN